MLARRIMWFALGLLALYLAFVLLLWGLQARLIYPAPSQQVALSDGFEEMTLETDDGLELRAFYREAADGRATVVHFHGNGGSLFGATLETEALGRAGHGLLLVEYRGYSGNPGVPSEHGLYSDARAAMDALRRRGLNAEEIVWAGNSIGSGPATHMAAEYGGRALVLISPFTELTSVAGEKLPFIPVRRLLRDRFDNASKIGRLEMPVLILHGTEDRIVPHSHGEALAERARQGELLLFEGAGHDLSFDPAAQQAVVEWLASLPVRSS